MIGIVGGVGPYAGLDLMKKVFDNTLALTDQDHLDVVMLSLSESIADRTEYLEGRVDVNPGLAIARVLKRLEEAGATVAGIPCNTAHAPGIFSVIEKELQSKNTTVRLLNMILETIDFIGEQMSGDKRVGVLSTTGEYRAGLYAKALDLAGHKVIKPSLEMQEELIHPAIYDPDFGIKTFSSPIKTRARENLSKGFAYLKEGGADLVILGCTEIPLAFPEALIMGMRVVDPTWILARALVRNLKPEKLKSYE